jgi:phosphoglycolate phosphatase
MNKNKYELIIFDWDGTLLDSFSAIIESVKIVCTEAGLTPPEDVEIRKQIGLDAVTALKYFYPDLSKMQLLHLKEQFLVVYTGKQHSSISLFPGTIEVLKKLQKAGCTLTVATGKSRRGLESDFATLKVGQYFSASRCAEETACKPDPLMLTELMEFFDVPVEKTLMVGDSIYDIEMASHLNMDAIAVKYSETLFDQRILSFNPLGCINTIDELLDFV